MNELTQETLFWDYISPWVYSENTAALNFLTCEKYSAQPSLGPVREGPIGFKVNFYVLLSFFHIWLFLLLTKAIKPSVLHSLIVRCLLPPPAPHPVPCQAARMRQMPPCQQYLGTILNKGCVFSPVPFTVSGCQPPMALLLDPAQLGTAG